MTARDTEVGEPAFDEAQHLVATLLGEDVDGSRFDELVQAILMSGETEEVVLLFDDLGRGPVDRAAAADQLVVRVELFAADAVEAAVAFAIDVAARGAGAPQLGHSARMTRVAAGLNVVVEAEVECAAQSPELGGVLV